MEKFSPERDAKQWEPVFRLKSRENKDSGALCDSCLSYKALVALAPFAVALGSPAAQASDVQVIVSDTGLSGVTQVVASWTQDQNPTPIEFVEDYYTTVPVFDAVGLSGDTAVTWYSDKDNHFGGFSNFDENFNVLGPANYAFTESAPTFVPGNYIGVNLTTGLTYIPTNYIIKLVPEVADPSVPEPGTWAMMIAGLGMIGCVARRRRKVSVAYA